MEKYIYARAEEPVFLRASRAPVYPRGISISAIRYPVVCSARCRTIPSRCAGNTREATLVIFPEDLSRGRKRDRAGETNEKQRYKQRQRERERERERAIPSWYRREKEREREGKRDGRTTKKGVRRNDRERCCRSTRRRLAIS